MGRAPASGRGAARVPLPGVDAARGRGATRFAATGPGAHPLVVAAPSPRARGTCSTARSSPPDTASARAIASCIASLVPEPIAKDEAANLGLLGFLAGSKADAGALGKGKIDAALDRPPRERAGLVEAACRDDPVLLAEARRRWRRAQARLLAQFGEDEWRRLEATLRGLRRLVR